MEVKYEDLEGVEHCDVIDVPIANNTKVNYLDIHCVLIEHVIYTIYRMSVYVRQHY